MVCNVNHVERTGKGGEIVYAAFFSRAYSDLVIFARYSGSVCYLNDDSNPKYCGLHYGNGNWDECEVVLLVAFEFCI